MNHQIRQVNVDYLQGVLEKTMRILSVLAEADTLEGAAASIVRDDLFLLKDSEGRYLIEKFKLPPYPDAHHQVQLEKAMEERMHLDWKPWFALVALNCKRQKIIVPQSFHFRWKERWELNMTPAQAISDCIRLMQTHGVTNHECTYEPGHTKCTECDKPPA